MVQVSSNSAHWGSSSQHYSRTGHASGKPAGERRRPASASAAASHARSPSNASAAASAMYTSASAAALGYGAATAGRSRYADAAGNSLHAYL